MTDPIASFINSVKMAAEKRLPTVTVPHSALKVEIAKVLTKAGYLKSSGVKGKRVKKLLEVELAYKAGVSPISHVRRISKPGKRVYAGVDGINSVREGRGMSVISTPKGILSDKEARKEKVGGELLFEIW